MNLPRRIAARTFGLLALFLAISAWLGAQDATDPLEQGFLNPPDSAKPRVWWHWMNGNITKEGIRLDLEWMKRVGIGGFQNFDAALNTPKLVDRRLVYMTAEWKDAFLFTTTLADQLGLEEAIAGSPGWSESGGPWVRPAQAMKKFVWSETYVEGGRPFTGTLPKPSSVSGPFQNIPILDFLALISGQTPAPPPTFYADSAVVAYRLPESDIPLSDLHPRITSSAGTIDAALLYDGDLVNTVSLPSAPVGKQSWIQFEFAKPQTIHAVTLTLGGFKNPFAESMGGAPSGPDLQSSTDGLSFSKILTIPGSTAAQNTVSFTPVIARFFRVSFTTAPPPSGAPPMSFDTTESGFGFPPPAPEQKIAELVLHSGARVNRFEEKAAFATLPDLYEVATPAVPANDSIARKNVLDLTSKMKADGSLDWTPPPGRWTVLRLGYSLTGVTNHPASPEGTGLEVDKLNANYVTDYMNKYLDNYQSAVGPLMGKRGLQFVISDSWEAGTQNWTDHMITEFTKRRGYDPHPWLPVLTGRIVESAEASDRFLWDFRKTLSDLLTENHYDLINTLLKARGMGHYGESHESGRAFIGDGMEVKRHNDVPMSAMWTQKPGVNDEQFGYNADIRESASVAHIYGQNLVAAESLTASSGAWAWSPATLKPTADKELAMGLNRFVIHTSVHQPLLDRQPGLSLGPFGQWFTRNETWAEQATAWVSYLSRSSYLLQQGHFAADIVYFYGEDSNLTSLFLHRSPDIPAGYNFDYINADALIHELSIQDGRLSTSSGMRYRVLALDPFSRHMSLPVLRKIQELVQAGAVVSGLKPVATPSLSDDQHEFQKLADQLWGSGAGVHSFGRGQVYSGQELGKVLASLKTAPDFEFTKPQAGTSLLFVHRMLPGVDLYFVNNRNDRFEDLTATFRLDGREAELWYADTGKIEPASFQISDGRTSVPLRLEPWGAVFVVFRRPAHASSRSLPKQAETSVATVDGSWDVSFQADRGAPPKVSFDRLSSWTASPDEGVKYFSGTATYTKTIQAPQDWFKPGAKLWIDLGDVKNLAEISVNGKSLGMVWKTPYRLDISGVLKPGSNTLEIRVTNGWANRIIGDRQPLSAKKYAFTSPSFYHPNSPLLPSGLLGPVQIVRAEAK